MEQTVNEDLGTAVVSDSESLELASIGESSEVAIKSICVSKDHSLKATESNTKKTGSNIPQRKNIPVTNPASKATGIKKVSNTLSLKKPNTSDQTSKVSPSNTSTPRSPKPTRNSNSTNPPGKRTHGSMSQSNMLQQKANPTKPPAAGNNRAASVNPANANYRMATTTIRPSVTAANKIPATKTNLKKMVSTAGDKITLESLEEQLKDQQNEFLKKIEALKHTSHAAQLEGKEYQLMGLVFNNECEPMLKDMKIEKLTEKLDENSANALKEKLIKNMNEGFAKLKDKLNREGDSGEDLKLKEIQDSNVKAILDLVDAISNSYKDETMQEVTNIEKLKKELEDYKNSLKIMQEKYSELCGKHEIELLALEKDIQSKCLATFEQKEQLINELQKKLEKSEKQIVDLQSHWEYQKNEDFCQKKNLEEELQNAQERFKEFQLKFKAIENDLSLQHKQVEQKNDIIEKLQTELKDLQASIHEQTLKPENDIEISQLKQTIETLQEEKSSLEEQNKHLIEDYNNSLTEAKEYCRELCSKHKNELLAVNEAIKSESLAVLEQKEEEIKELQKLLKINEGKIAELQSTLAENENITNELKTNSERFQKLEDNFKALEKDLSLRSQEVNQKNGMIQNLQKELKVLQSSMEQQTLKYENDKETPKLLKKITTMNQQIQKLLEENSLLEKKNQQLVEDISKNKDLTLKLEAAQNRLKGLQQELNDIKKLNESKDNKIELTKLRQSEIEKDRQIAKLNAQLSKSLAKIYELEMQLQRNQQLLEVRSQLIDSLQENEANHRLHMGEKIVEMGEKNNTIAELTQELCSCSQEVHTLNEKIYAKQLEFTEQQHIIKLLEENNKRSQIMRIKQEEKMSRMTEDIAHMQKIIEIYQANLLNANTNLILKQQALMPPNNRMEMETYDINENFYHYTDQRKRKRQIAINVKTYEA
uniref:Uncharacterized protein n=1 Tax=Stomoxys calcitrans TaxID=35570 RepID=A0A1I8QB94_STOCA